ncbi:hypothetical protein A3766_20100 [Oleiphilus sp. HI0132]|uniref:hypothetical protein n=2 Tax=Oleiphilus sp. HI0132 TaxID=1822270 RepID=UPI0007C38887|nr:hypothetical protein [Oleiphilus sp. HI0132]KZZ73399.1 hypothetical protein A3766_20100 [Oleiphilus sp. HI0132]
MLMPISPVELISISKRNKLISGYIMGFHHQIISRSPFKPIDQQGILVESYYNLFGSDDAQEILDFTFSNLRDEVFKSGFDLGSKDITDFSRNSKNAPLGLLRILHKEDNSID